MHTSELQRDHPEVYKEFFEQYDLVVSAPIIFSITWVNLGYTNWNETTLGQKIPLRNYIWIRSGDSLQTTCIQKSSSWDPFIIDSLQRYYDLDAQLLSALWFQGSIWFLSEYNWIDVPSIFANLLIANMLQDGTLSPDDFAYLNLRNNYEPVLDTILKKWQNWIDKYWVFKNQINSCFFLGWTILASETQILAQEINRRAEYRNLDSYTCDDLDLSLCILNPGTLKKCYHQNDWLFQRSKKLRAFAQDAWMHLPTQDLLDGIEIIDFHSAMEIFQDLVHRWSWNRQWRELFEHLSQQRNIRHDLYWGQKYDFSINDIEKMIQEHVHDNQFSIRTAGSRVAVYGEKIFRINETILDIINADQGTNFSIDVDSHEDGWETGWVQLEQWRSRGIYSDFCRGSHSVSIYTGNDSSLSFGTYDACREATCDIILDSIKRKILIQWEKVTSKELHSQATTCDILCMLVQSLGEDISSTNLPQSSYTTNKNDMLWKIVGPLIKTIETKTQKRLPLSCSGWTTQFVLRLDPSDVSIGVIGAESV